MKDELYIKNSNFFCALLGTDSHQGHDEQKTEAQTGSAVSWAKSF